MGSIKGTFADITCNFRNALELLKGEP